MKLSAISLGIFASAAGFTVAAGEHSLPTGEPSKAAYSPYVDQDFPNQLLFGDTHLHTAYSADAGLVGATLEPDDAFRYAKGEVVTSSTGVRARLFKPLDFLVVTDHAENLGLPSAMRAKNPLLMANPWGAEMVEAAAPGTIESMIATYEMWMGKLFAGDDPLAGTDFANIMWHKATAAAESNNAPGAFTAMIGYEWTAQPDGANMHRNIIYRDGKKLADQLVPFSAYDSDDPERLWDWLEAYESKTGGRVLAIAHNGNLSNGLMFDDVTLTDKRPLDAAYAERRMRWEPIYEVTQIKGDGEAHPALSPEDELADYVTWDNGSFGPVAKTPDMLPKEYARSAYLRGLAYEAKTGANPFKFGMIGSTDAHTGLTGATEDNFFGKVAAVEPSANPMRFNEPITGRFGDVEPQRHWMGAAAGLAGVWAHSNTREAIWDAMNRKEVYATTGTRMQVRVFAGWDFTEADLPRHDFASYGYAHGVPMGGDLVAAPKGKEPQLLIRAMRDPDGANLDRLQVVKGWTRADGSTAEAVYDVAWSGDRVLDGNGKLGAIGDTVDAKQATYTNSIGEPYLKAFWTDPAFDPKQRAFYYVRVLEIPTPRWTTFDRKIFGVALPEGAPLSIQERAYTSPIWYTP